MSMCQYVCVFICLCVCLCFCVSVSVRQHEGSDTGTPLVGTFCAGLPFIGLEVNQRPLLLCLSVPNLITGGSDPPHTGLWKTVPVH